MNNENSSILIRPQEEVKNYITKQLEILLSDVSSDGFVLNPKQVEEFLTNMKDICEPVECLSRIFQDSKHLYEKVGVHVDFEE